MATSESTQSALCEVQSLTFCAQSKIKTTLDAARLQLELPDVEAALPTIHALLDACQFYIEGLANDVDVTLEQSRKLPS